MARVGGDELVGLCADVPDLETADQIAERLQKAVAAPMNLDDEDASTTVSTGVAVASAWDQDADAFAQRADAAMYRAKRSGRNRHVLAAVT